MAISKAQTVPTGLQRQLRTYEDPRQQKCSHVLLLIMDPFLQSVMVNDMRDCKANVMIKKCRDHPLQCKIFPTPFLMRIMTFSEMLKRATPFCKSLFLLHNRTHSLHLPQIHRCLALSLLVS